MERVHRLGLVIFASVLAGCTIASSPNISRPRAPQANDDAALATALQQVQAKRNEYKIGAADLLDITVFQQPDMDRKLRVSQNGTISLPLIGAVTVGGLSVTEAQSAVADRLKEYVINPQVTIFIREYGNKKIFILGEVKNPGSYELPTEARLTVLEAVSLAGGFTPIAAPDRTRIIRSVNGQNQSINIEVSAITRRGEKDKDLPLEPNDVLFVPQSYF